MWLLLCPASLPRAELQQCSQCSQCRSVTSATGRLREGQCSPEKGHWGAGDSSEWAAATQLQEPGAGQRSCAPGHGHPGAPEACCKAWPLLLRAKPYLCHWCSLSNNEHKGIPHSHREQPACLQHRLHAGWRLKRGEGPDQWESCCALRPCFTLWSPDQCWCRSA